ncbi:MULTISPECIES: hypothetical protein [unclassified Tolypothrix]|uniref:hypothetical protein n=1 Tax=unclassified Tolypothrix TaxID=2649714 RepID=UPI0005EAB88F|nr:MULTISPECIES: hypothetical protein [unclassified Tolypothrix]BAY93666.1 hypothetical protein NIES3275_57080 [Microchaete diplosiphon NIES-3275]EKE99532.1 hypothetical protein FDUTEX481_09792 [Tolypothrix sp. PCC 7601]MBE9081719.1 hypothetical protein [Tolypothrix sp. LEGE 11397]UYD27486.1 hypothetical protein HGR01_05195 [Tolypothrix sp. PCC 7712]UYD36650.1 hypothetical protein HG267_13515 [Tolypothrix sp. PCC 7601]
MPTNYRSFLGDANSQVLTIPNFQTNSPAKQEREKIKHTLIGSSKAVMATIRVLHQLGYADIGDWSPLLPTNNPGEVMSILIRSINLL